MTDILITDASRVGQGAQPAAGAQGRTATMRIAQEQPPSDSGTRTALLEATGRCIQAFGYAGMTTRRVAELAGVPLSQIHYHFGSKQKMVLALLEYETGKLLARQRAMVAQPVPLSDRWERACDYLDDDLASGYVRVLNEMIAAGYANAEIATEVRRLTGNWQSALHRLAADVAEQFGPFGTFSPGELASLIGMAFIGAEHLILLGVETEGRPIRSILRRIGELIRRAEAARP